jgi:chemotaxis signal transduction protein
VTLAATSVALNGAHRNDSSLSMTFCRLGDLRFAVPLNDVVQAIRQPQLTLLPRRDQAIAGVFVYRQQTIPLLDLRRWLPWPDERSELPGQILLLRQNAHLVGVAIDQVEGLQRVPGSQIQRVVQREDDEELFHSTVSIAAGEQESQALGLLDVDALIRLSQVWSAADEEFATSIAAADSELAATAAAASASTVPHALFELAGQVLAIPAADVAAVISMPVVTTILGRHPAWLGMTIWRERDVPVLRTMAALGLPPQAADESAHDTTASAQENLLVILGSEGRYAGLPVQVARAVTPLDTSAAQTAASAGLPVNTVLSGVLHLNAAERLLLVDGAELVNTCSLSALSQKAGSAKQDQQNQQPDQQSQADQDAALQAHVVVQGGRPGRSACAGWRPSFIFRRSLIQIQRETLRSWVTLSGISRPWPCGICVC